MTISLLAAFLGGLISLLSPCSALVIPSFLATTFTQRKKLFLATIFFSLGVLSIMLPLGFGLLILINFFNQYRKIITTVIGLVLIIEAILQLFNRSLMVSRQHQLKAKSRKNLVSAFYFGFISGIGAMSCVGPILGGIITLAANTNNVFQTFNLIFSYTLGIVVPLLLLTLLWQKNQTKATAILRGKVINLGQQKLHLVNLAASLFLFILGLIFIRYQGNLTRLSFFSHSDILNYLFDLQDKLFNL